MALGTCKDCDKLVPIEPREPLNDGTPRRHWYAADHERPGGGRCVRGSGARVT